MAKEEGFALIVMGHKGTGRFTDMLLGSVTDKVAHMSVVPVAIVRDGGREGAER